MKPTSTLFFFMAILVAIITTGYNAEAQQYKLRQTTGMAGMKSESTIYVKGARKRTEGGGYMAQNANLVTIEQCDLQRTIRINDKKKLYYIEPFAKDIQEEVIEEDVRPAAKKPVPAVAKEKTTPAIGGVINMWYNITDTGERKKMYGFTARHVWTTQKIKPSPDACMMKDSMLIKTEGWYIDLPQFNCPVNNTGRGSAAASQYQPECKDRFISRRSGKGKLGFPLIETRTMIMGNGAAQSSEFATTLETLEFSTIKLDSMLFEIPLGYTATTNPDDLQDKMDVNEIMKQAAGRNNNNNEIRRIPTEQKKSGVTRIGVYEPKGEDPLQVSLLQTHLVNTLTGGSIEAVAITSEEDAKKYHCDLLLNTEFTRVKQGSKVGSLLKAIKNTDPSATSAYNIEASLTLVNVSDGSTRVQQKVNGKYDGKIDEAAAKALDKGCSQVVKELR